MLTTRTHRLTPPKAAVEADGSVVVEASDTIVRQHVAGRYKGAVEHTELRFQFTDKAAALLWLDQARAEVELAP